MEREADERGRRDGYRIGANLNRSHDPPASIGALLALLLMTADALARPTPAELGWPHAFRIEETTFRMRDGVALSATLYWPVPHRDDERFPVLLELLPYRKDDSFHIRDHRHHTWFAGHGFLSVKVDIRGTGSSGGRVPDREYSDAEMSDALELIDQLSRLPGSSGRVGMWGISWGGFNALQVAMRRPPALGAILAVDASDDLYHDDVRYHDGVLHFDAYQLEIDHENGLPRSPDYRIDETYFAERFEAPPWFLTYLDQPLDGPFWRENSLRGQYDRIQVPVFLIGGLQDAYRDSIPRMLESMKVPMKAWLGPWDHDFPDTGTPGPNHGWRQEAARWWNRWLRGDASIRFDEPRLAVYVRSGHPPDRELAQAPGSWRHEEWPIVRTRWDRHDLDGTGNLTPPDGSRPAAGLVELPYRPGCGTAAGDWWGGPTGDMRGDDRCSLTFDSPVLSAPVEIVGCPRVRLRARVDAPLAHWVARLEDVGPDGGVTLVTGAALNGSQRRDRLNPEPLVPREVAELAFDLHVTTWTFRPGHRIRLAIANAQFPMLWPTPHPMTMQLRVGAGESWLELPRIPSEERPRPEFPPPEELLVRPDAGPIGEESQGMTKRARHDPASGRTWFTMEQRHAYAIGARRFEVDELCVYRTHDSRPDRSSVLGRMSTRIHLPDQHRSLELKTLVTIRSTVAELHVHFRRRLIEDGRMVRSRIWRQVFPRRFQ